ncbi:MAG: hypothetical protein HQL26_05825 [Candidatus Omnitrophica bacterium]|nr:hypothetical protein [Candidatus Omnitrophota bacterium]
MKNPKETLIKIFIAAVIIVTCINAITLAADTRRRLRQNSPFAFYGEAFFPLRDILKGESRIGYITDQDFKDAGPMLRYLQIQYALAPIIVDTKNFNQHFILLNCADQKIALSILQKFNLKPLKRNSFGVILAENLNH